MTLLYSYSLDVPRYTDAMDGAVAGMLSSLEVADRMALQDVVSITSTGLKYQPVGVDGTTSLMLGLNHSQPAIRVLALQQLAKNMEQDMVSKSVMIIYTSY